MSHHRIPSAVAYDAPRADAALGIEIMAEEINAALLTALAGPGAPTLPYVETLAKDIRRGRANPGKMIASILYCAKLMNRPTAQRARIVAKLDALGLTSDTPTRPTAPADLARLHEAEEDAEVALDKAQMRQSREPHSIAARVAVEQAAERVIATTRALADACTRSRVGEEAERRTSRRQLGITPDQRRSA